MRNGYRYVGWAGLFATAWVALGCSSADAPPVPEQTASTEPMSFDTYFQRHVVWDQAAGMYNAEGDLGFRTIEEVRAHFARNWDADQSLIVDQFGAGVDNKWSYSQKRNLTYCISNSFNSDHAQVTDAMLLATGAWEEVADVRFVYVPGHNSNCTPTNNSVVFNVVPFESNTFLAEAFVPSEPRSQRELNIDLPEAATSFPWTLTGVLIHELGHALGFLHEQLNGGSLSGSCADSETTWRALSPYDSLSVMHYPQCAGTNARDLNITQRDAQGAVALYDAPTNVVVSSVGLFARKMSNGDIYRKNTSGAGWTRIGGPGRSFVAVASHLYALNATGTGVFRYSGSGTTWNSIGGPAGLLFNCGSGLCATDPTSGDIFRYDGTSWSFIGGAGRRFVGVNSTVYGQTPNWQALFQWTGSGSSWNWIGGEYLDIIGGAGTVGLFAIQNGTRNLLRYSGGTFSSVGGPGAQFLGSGELFALTPDRGSVWKYNGSSWFNVGGGASRLYGQNSNVYATSGGFDIWALVPNTSNWNFLGQP